MAGKTAHTRKPRSGKAAPTPRQVALVLPHASAVAGPSFESALETLNSNLAVHKLWRAKPAGKRAAR